MTRTNVAGLVGIDMQIMQIIPESLVCVRFFSALTWVVAGIQLCDVYVLAATPLTGQNLSYLWSKHPGLPQSESDSAAHICTWMFKGLGLLAQR